jgi:hypothetical protein
VRPQPHGHFLIDQTGFEHHSITRGVAVRMTIAASIGSAQAGAVRLTGVVCARRRVLVRKQQPMPRGPATRPMRSSASACNLSGDEMAFRIEVVSDLVMN